MSANAVDPQSSARPAEEQQRADAERHAGLVEVIAWLDALPNTSISDVVIAQRSRLTQELQAWTSSHI